MILEGLGPAEGMVTDPGEGNVEGVRGEQKGSSGTLGKVTAGVGES